MTIPLDQIIGMPAFSPYYPLPKTRYRNVQAHYIAFRADLSAVDRVLPECFEPSDDGYCVAFGLTVPWTSSYGAFQESGLFVRCRYQGQTGYFVPVVFLNSRGSIPAGREIWGTPKVFADVELELDERVLVTDTRLVGTSILSLRSTMDREATVEDVPSLDPAWRLKVIPRADGTGADVFQIVGSSDVVTEVTTHIVRAGDGVVELHPSPVYDLSDFTPREYFGAYYTETDFTEGYGEVVKDFLAEEK